MNKRLTEYLIPETLEEALSFYSRYNPGDVCWLAGGTDLKLPINRSFKAAVDIKRIQALKGMGQVNNETYTIGALTTIQELEDNPEISDRYPVLTEAARQFGSRQVRERGTVGGNICHGSPSADVATALLSLDAKLCWYGPNGQVYESLSGYYSQEKEKRRDKTGYILEKVYIPLSSASSMGTYLKLGERGALEIGLVSIALVIMLEGNRIKDARISLGGAAPSPVRAARSESVLRGSETNDNSLFLKAGSIAKEECVPITDAYASAEYRKAMIETLVKRGLEMMLQRGDHR